MSFFATRRAFVAGFVVETAAFWETFGFSSSVARLAGRLRLFFIRHVMH